MNLASFLLRHTPALSLAALLCAGSSAAAKPFTFDAPTELTAVVTNGNVDLHWKNNATAPGGVWVEFTTPGDEFTKLEPEWPETTTYRHPDVAPETQFIYRIHPFYGQPSAEVLITTGKPVTGTTNLDEEGPLPPTGKETTDKKKSIRNLATFAEAAPDGVTAKLSSPTSVELRWNDRASDEEGYLVEVAAVGEKEFKLCALLPADATSFRKTQLPAETKCRFRVRAFFYGESSNRATVTTLPLKPNLPKATP